MSRHRAGRERGEAGSQEKVGNMLTHRNLGRAAA
jgi:hypothetical protein